MRVYFDLEPENKLADTLVRLKMQSIKYQIMWALRGLESEIDSFDGIIMIHGRTLDKKPEIHLDGFPYDLKLKMKKILDAVSFE